jgi:hypothetical protein
MAISFKFLEIHPISGQALYSFIVLHAETDRERNKNYLNMVSIIIELFDENLRAF